MRVVVTGATGFVGRRLCTRLLARGDEVVAFSRDAARAAAALPAGVKAVGWTPGKPGPWAEALSGAAGVVHLASEAPKQRRFDAAYWKVLRGSRVEGTLALVEAMAAVPEPPRVLVSASAITVYGERGDELLHEDSRVGSDASAQLCADWEAAALTAQRHGIRAVPMRIGFALGREGGPLAPVLGLFRWFLGARLGRPEQWIAWIHVDDLTGFVAHALADGGVRGVHNLTAPAPARAADFFRAVGEATGRPCWLGLSDPLLRAMLGDIAPMLLSSLRALPTRTLASGYRFQYPALPEALRHL